jgi:hypothetical protein
MGIDQTRETEFEPPSLHPQFRLFVKTSNWQKHVLGLSVRRVRRRDPIRKAVAEMRQED